LYAISKTKNIDIFAADLDEEEESKEQVDVERSTWFEVWALVGIDRVVLEKLTISPSKSVRLNKEKFL
jgi:hypothetical protein